MRQASFQLDTSTFGITRPCPYPGVLGWSGIVRTLRSHRGVTAAYPVPMLNITESNLSLNSCSRDNTGLFYVLITGRRHECPVILVLVVFIKECVRMHIQLGIFPGLPVCSLDLVPFTILTYSRSLKHHHSWRWHLGKRISWDLTKCEIHSH